MFATHVMASVPGADRGPRAGSPHGVMDATGLTLASSNERTVPHQIAPVPGRYRSRY